MEKEGLVISFLSSRRIIVLLIVLLTVMLVACERPLNPEEEGTPAAEPTTAAPQETQPGQEAAPTLVPTLPVPSAEPTTTTGEQPAPETGQPTAVPEGGAGEASQPEPGGETQPEPTAEQPSQPAGEQVHVVQAGENLFRIGLQYGCTVNELAAYNGIANPNYINVGQQIRIPATCGG